MRCVAKMAHEVCEPKNGKKQEGSKGEPHALPIEIADARQIGIHGENHGVKKKS